MGGRLTMGEFLFSSAGRTGRIAFVVGALVLLGIALGLRAITPLDLRWTGWLTGPPILFSAACLIAKRLHDVGRRGWWGVVVLEAVLQLWIRPEGLAGFIAVLALAWFSVDLLFRPGDDGLNRFGPPGGQRVAP